VPNVQWKTPDDGQMNCPKHVEFLDKNKFGKIRAYVGFIKKEFFNTCVFERFLPHCPGSSLLLCTNVRYEF